MLLADDLSQGVGLRSFKAGQINGRLAQLLLKDHYPEGLLQDGPKERVRRLPGLAMKTGDPGVDGLVGGGPDDGDDHDVEEKVVHPEIGLERDTVADLGQDLAEC